MKDLDFEKDSKKLKIIGRTKLGKAWIDTLKPSSRKIKPGSEKYVINAFVKWKKQQKTLNATNKTTIADGSPNTNDTTNTNAVNTQMQSVQNSSTNRRFTISALILSVKNTLSPISRICFRNNFIKKNN